MLLFDGVFYSCFVVVYFFSPPQGRANLTEIEFGRFQILFILFDGNTHLNIEPNNGEES